MIRPRFGELLRFAIVTTIRESVPPENPEILRSFAGLGWRLDRRARPERANIVVEEAQRCFGVGPITALAMAREAHDVGFQARMEELIVPRTDPALLGRYTRVTGTLPASGVVMLGHAGNPLLAMAMLARMRPGLVVLDSVPARAPAGSAGRRMAARFREEQRRLPVLWESDPASLPSHVAAGRTVVVRWDDRSGTPRPPATLLGRPVTLSRVGWIDGAPIVPAFIHRLPDKTWTLDLRPPVPNDPQAFLAGVVEPWMMSHGAQWLTFLADCRAGLHARPMFDDELTIAEAPR